MLLELFRTPEKELKSYIKEISSGNESVLEQFYNKYARSIYTLIFSYVDSKESADAVLQDVLISIVRCEPDKPIQNARAWILRVIKNASVNRVLKDKVSQADSGSGSGEIKDALVFKMVEDDIDRIDSLKCLSQIEQKCVLLCVIGGLKLPEVAGILNIPYDKVRNFYYYSLKKLRHYYEMEEKMKNKEVIDRIRDDISDMTLPPISENVLQAVREKKAKYNDSCVQADEMKKPKRNISKKFIAAIAVSVIAVPVILAVIYKVNVCDVPCESVVTESNSSLCEYEDHTSSYAESRTVLERIKLKHLYGEVNLSDKSEEELETLLTVYFSSCSVYEDDNYLYSFDPNGELCEVITKRHYTEPSVIVSGADIERIADDLFELYYPERSITSYKKEITGSINSLPAWVVRYMKTDGESITITFDKGGQLRMVQLNGNGKDAGKISKKEAVDIVIKEARNEKYGFPEFSDEYVEITVNNKTIGNKQLYYISIAEKPHDGYFLRSMLFSVDANSGETVLLDKL